MGILFPIEDINPQLEFIGDFWSGKEESEKIPNPQFHEISPIVCLYYPNGDITANWVFSFVSLLVELFCQYWKTGIQPWLELHFEVRELPPKMQL